MRELKTVACQICRKPAELSHTIDDPIKGIRYEFYQCQNDDCARITIVETPLKKE